MTHLNHSRTFVSMLLIVVLQLAFLPRVGACGRSAFDRGACCCAETGALRTGQDALETRSDACCGAPEASAAGSCCGGSESDREPGDPGPGETGPVETASSGKRLCGCTAPHSTVAARCAPGEHESQRQDQDDDGPRLAAHRIAILEPDVHARFVARLLPGATPRPPTGPPLYLRKQVFLI